MKYPASSLNFREDINGLRAWAVLAVLLFHFKISAFTGGFAGVDVFFVLSGYLMAAIVVRDLEKGRFSFWKFYLARARRILPALILLIGVLLTLGWHWLPTPEYKLLGIQSVYSLNFISNIYFWKSAGYFDNAAQEKWLLHTWSLSVEWQFYILFPVFLFILWRARPSLNALWAGMGFLFVASLALSVFSSPWNSPASFYLLPTRGWEMAAGSLVFMSDRRFDFKPEYRQLFQILGWLLLAGSFLLLSKEYHWPSGWAALPVLGTVLILLSNSTNSLLTSHPIAQWIGHRSYSIYLWHWPLAVALYFYGLHDSPSWVTGTILLSLLLGHLSFIAVETPTRTHLAKAGFARQVVQIGAFLTAVVIFAACAHVFEFSRRLPLVVQAAASESANTNSTRNECFDPADENGSPGCVYGNDKEIGAILMGDSHALSIISAAGDAAQTYNKGVLFWGMVSCPTLKGVLHTDRARRKPTICRDFNEWAFSEIQKYPSHIPLVLVSRITGYLVGPNEPDRADEAQYTTIYFTEQYKYRRDPAYQKEFLDVMMQTVCSLAKSRPVYFLRPIPEMALDVPKTVTRRLMLSSSSIEFRITRQEYLSRHALIWGAQDVAAKECGVRLLDPLPFLCDEQHCYGSRHARPLYSDDDHLSEYGNRYLIPMFRQIFHASNKAPD